MIDVGAVVVHHNHFPEVLVTVGSLLNEGVPPSLLVVVDNSDNPLLLDQLRAGLPTGVHLKSSPNLGYGAAANLGVDILFSLASNLLYVLIATHETRPEAGALKLLWQAMEQDKTLAVVGPTLIINQDNQRYHWSCGGIYRRILNEPRHVGSGALFAGSLSGPIEYRSWVDGAFCLYRIDLLAKTRFREDFFLYFEETELHARLTNLGYRVGWVPAATVEQSSGGVPPYLLARNLQRFQTLHGSLFQRIVTVPFIILRRSTRRIVRGGPPNEIQDLLRGWRNGV